LERGEAEVIVLAKEKGIKHVLIDEKIARQQAGIQELNVIGTLGLLLKAKKKGLLSSIKPLILNIRDNGIWIKDEIVNGILKDAGEEL
jgi:predicted nucleic acid-binding protein